MWVACLAQPSNVWSDRRQQQHRRPPAPPGLLGLAADLISTSTTAGARHKTAPRLEQGSSPDPQELGGRALQEQQRRIAAQLKACRTLHELSSCIKQHGREAILSDATCVAAAFRQLPRLMMVKGSGPPGAGALSQARQELAALVRDLSLAVADNAVHFEAQHLVAVAVGLAKLHCNTSPSGGSHGAAAASFPEDAAASASSPAPSSSSAVVSPGQPSAPELYALVLEHTHHRLSSLNPRLLANIIWALAASGTQPCGSWLSEYYAAVEEQLPGMTLQDIADVMWGLCKLELMPDAELADHLMGRALSQAQQATPSGSDAATIVTCLARLYYKFSFRVSDEWLSAFLSAVQPALWSFAPADLVSLVHSAVCLNYMPQRGWMLEYYGVLKDRLLFDPTLPLSDLSRLLWALSRIDVPPPRSWLREFVAVTVPRLAALRCRALAEVVWALACWGHRPSHEWLAAYMDASGAKLLDYRPQELSTTVSALAKLGCKVPTWWLGLALDSFGAQLADARAHELVTFLESATELCDDKQWLRDQRFDLQAIADAAASKFDLCDCLMHSSLVVALAKAGCCPGATWLKQQQASLARVWTSDSLDAGTARDLQQAYMDWEVELDKGLARELGLVIGTGGQQQEATSAGTPAVGSAAREGPSRSGSNGDGSPSGMPFPRLA